MPDSISSDSSQVHVIGAGLAGSEACWQLSRSGIRVTLHEMRPVMETPVHKTDLFAELVCSNSLRSDDPESSAVGLLHEEMRRMDSLIMAAADKTRVPAGSALAVDRNEFSREITMSLSTLPQFFIKREEITEIHLEDRAHALIATGPLTSDKLAHEIQRLTDVPGLAFFDALSPVIHADSIDMTKVWRQSRYDKEKTEDSEGDYLNCPMTKEEYEAFITALLAGETTSFQEFEKNTPYFDGCLPIEVMAERGRDTLRFGPMKPVGLTDPRNPETKPHAVVQLRQDNTSATLFNVVGFQTKLKHYAQKEIFQRIPGLENAVFARLGGVHRNTYLDSPRLLTPTLQLRKNPKIRFAGQITGCEGYVESAAVGLIAGRLIAAEVQGKILPPPPITTAVGALIHYITEGAATSGKRGFQPMNVNFGLFPPLPDGALKRKKNAGEKRKEIIARARKDFSDWLTLSEK